MDVKRLFLSELLRRFTLPLFFGILLYAELVDLAVSQLYLFLVVIGLICMLVQYRQIHEVLVSSRQTVVFWVTPLLLLSLWTILSSVTVLGAQVFISQWEAQQMSFYLLVPFVYFAFYFARPTIEQFFKTLILAALCLVPYDLIACFLQDARGVGTMSIPIIRGDMGMGIGLVSLAAALGMSSRRWRWAGGVGFIAGVILSVMSGSRGGWLAFFTFVPFVFYLAYKRSKVGEVSVYRDLKWILLTFLIVFLLCPHNPFLDRVITAINNLLGFSEGHYQTSVGWRLVMWKAALWGWLEKPFMGWGLTHYWDLFRGYLDATGMPFREKFYFHQPHNEYLRFLAETGTLGLVFYLMVYAGPLALVYSIFRRLSATYGDFSRIPRSHFYLLVLILACIETVAEFSLTFLGLTSIMIGYFYIVTVTGALAVLNRLPVG